MVSTKRAIFVGGPADGQAMLIPKGTPPVYLYVVWNKSSQTARSMFDPADPFDTTYKTLEYRREIVHGLPETSIEFYSYVRMY